MSIPPKIIFTLKKVVRKPRKKRLAPLSPNSDFSLNPAFESFKCPEPKRKPVKIIRSLTLDNNRNQQPYRQPENECFYAKDRENEFFNTYQINLNVYSLYGYTSTMDQYLQRLAHNSLKYTEKIYLKFDLLFILKGMIKSFMFNELELVFLSYFLEENKWDYISCFSEANKLNELPEKFQTHYEIEKPLEYKALILYLMYSCMAIKQIFRENNETFMFFAFVSKILEDFPLDFNEWRKKNQDFLIFEPLRLNTVFEKNSFSWNGLEETFTQTQNLDIMVNKILEMSPPYLYEKSDITYSKKNMDFEFPSTYDIKSEIRNPLVKNEFISSNAVPKDPISFENFHREDSFRRMGNFYKGHFTEDYLKLEPNFSLPRADSIRSNFGFNSIFSNLLNNNDLNEKSSQEMNINPSPTG